MMLYPAVNELQEKTDSRYTLCILAAKRARDIIDGKPVLTDVQVERPVSLAVNEIYEGDITYYRPGDVETVEVEEIVATPDEVAEVEVTETAVEEPEAAGEEPEVAEEVAEVIVEE